MTAPPCQPDGSAAKSTPRAPGLGSAVRTGMGWMTGAAILAKFGSLIAQLGLAKLLAPSDFGIYATALGVAGFVTAFRDGGVAMYLIKQGPKQYPLLAAPVHWFAFATNLVGMGVLGAIAVGLALSTATSGSVISAGEGSPFLDPRLPIILAIIALSLPLGTPGAILKAKLRLDLSFGVTSLMGISTAFIRYGGSLGLALAGAGVYSFVLPMPLIAVVEWLWGQAATRDRAWIGRPNFACWPAIFRDSKWLLLGTFGCVVYNLASYFVIALFVGTSVVGVYFFAYQMTQQVCALITTNLQYVLAPVLVHISDESERMRAASLKTLRVLLLLAVLLMFGVAATIAPFEALVFQGKWVQAVRPIHVFGLLSPLAMTWGLTYSILTSQGRFRQWALLSLAEGAGVTLAAAIAAGVTGSALGISTATALAMATSRLTITLVSMSTVGVRPRETLVACTKAWAVGFAAVPLVYLIDTQLVSQHPGVRFLVDGTVLVIAFTVGVRVFLSGDLRDVLSIVPRPLRRHAERLLMMTRSAEH